MPAQRTRSLTREEARSRNEDDDGRLDPSSRSVSAQRLGGRPSRADSRVTFALDTLDKSEAPVPPARSKDHSTSKHESRIENHVDRPSANVDITSNEVSPSTVFVKSSQK